MTLAFVVPGLDEAASEKAIAILQNRLSQEQEAALVLKHAHWNVTGPNFIAVHEMLDPEVEAVVITSIDPIHHDYVMKTLAEEKWCFCEKPSALPLWAAPRMAVLTPSCATARGNRSTLRAAWAPRSISRR